MVTVNSDCTQLTIESTNLDNFIANPANYTQVEVIGTQNDGSEISKVYTAASPIIGTGDVTTNAGVENINPSFFTATVFADGIYKFVIKLTDLVDVVIEEEECVFVDCGTSCQVVDLVVDTPNLQAQLDHFLLSQANNCSCKCDKLLAIWQRLSRALNDDCETC